MGHGHLAAHDQETECELAKEVENRINKALIDMEDPWADACLLIDDDDDDDEEWDLLRPTREVVVPPDRVLTMYAPSPPTLRVNISSVSSNSHLPP